MIKQVFDSFCTYLGMAAGVMLIVGIFSVPVAAQSTDAPKPDDKFETLRSDVGIHGLTANIHALSNLNYKGNSDSLKFSDSSELEFVYRNIRMMMPRLGVGYQLLTSFRAGGDSGFGVGSWGAGPVVRGYPIITDQVQPYVQLNSLFGKNLGVGKLANTKNVAKGFRVRLGVRAGVAVRLTNDIGLFSEIGYDWESSRVFRADARALQFNVGIDLYWFKYLTK